MLRALDDPTALDRYLELKADEKRIKEELKALQDTIFYALQEEDGQKAEHLGCELSIRYRNSYEYTMETQILEQKLKARQQYERSAGEAVVTKSTGYVVVTAR